MISISYYRDWSTQTLWVAARLEGCSLHEMAEWALIIYYTVSLSRA